MLQLPVYMDYHATTPCDQRVIEAMLPWFGEHFGNASSRGHLYGWQAAEAVEMAREQVAALIGAESSEIIFTSGATEAVNLGIKGIFELLQGKGKHIITLATEHRAVLDTCLHLEKWGAEISYLPIRPDGTMDPYLLQSSIRPDTILIVVMYANNETGVLQPIREIGAMAKSKGVLFLTDATQAAGKTVIDVHRDQIDLLALSAHKMYGPKGVGALYVRRKDPRVRLIAQQDGGGQERGFRSGTLNIPGIVGFGKAAELSLLEMEGDMNSIGKLRNRLEDGILALGGNFLNGSKSHRVATVTNISFVSKGGEKLIEQLFKEVAVSSGSACSSASPEPSHVLKAMGRNDDLAFNAIRFSLGKFNTLEEVEYVIGRVGKALSVSPAYTS